MSDCTEHARTVRKKGVGYAISTVNKLVGVESGKNYLTTTWFRLFLGFNHMSCNKVRGWKTTRVLFTVTSMTVFETFHQELGAIKNWSEIRSKIFVNWDIWTNGRVAFVLRRWQTWPEAQFPQFTSELKVESWKYSRRSIWTGILNLLCDLGRERRLPLKS